LILKSIKSKTQLELILVLAYAVTLGNAFATDAVGIAKFPPLGAGKVAC
jgi:hypothetical protein